VGIKYQHFLDALLLVITVNDTFKVVLKTTKQVKPEKELFLDYGAAYWEGKGGDPTAAGRGRGTKGLKAGESSVKGSGRGRKGKRRGYRALSEDDSERMDESSD
jgi:hypothetical protein